MDKEITIKLSRATAMQCIKDWAVVLTVNSTLAGKESYQSPAMIKLIGEIEKSIISVDQDG